jgi:hypothetical protein
MDGVKSSRDVMFVSRLPRYPHQVGESFRRTPEQADHSVRFRFLRKRSESRLDERVLGHVKIVRPSCATTRMLAGDKIHRSVLGSG